MNQLRIGVLASGRGTALTPLISAITNKGLDAIIVLIISDRLNAPILEHQQKYGIVTKCIPIANPEGHITSKEQSRAKQEQLITQELQTNKINLILSVGYMRILSKDFIDQWQGKILNVHPSLLPAFAGLMDLDLHRAVLATKAKVTGCTVHIVTEQVDAGPVILQKQCPVLPNDTPETLKERVQKLEGEALVMAVQKFIQR
jgi:phosphoribosylglycinamide formyltransferase-1